MATDESKYTFPKIELPTGGGSIAGMGESFAAQPFTGTAAFSLPIPVPSARETSPALALSYSSSGGNGVFGLGFDIGLPSIARKTSHGVPSYTNADVFVASDSGDLVPDGSPSLVEPPAGWTVRVFRPQLDVTYIRYELWTEAATRLSYWRSVDANGTVTLYGTDGDSRISDPADQTRIFSWLVASNEDVYGNKMRFTYRRENADGVTSAIYELGRSNTANRYPDTIEYGNYVDADSGDERFTIRVAFDYSRFDANDPTAPRGVWLERLDPFSTYSAGFEIRTYRLCRAILVYHCFPPLADGELLPASATIFDYDESPSLSRLASVQTYGYRQDAGSPAIETAWPPPVSFEFTPFDPSAATFDPLVVAGEGDAAGLFDEKFLLADLHGEGLPGLLYSSADRTAYWEPLGDGRYECPRAPWTFPIDSDLRPEGVALVDLDGDGLLDVVVTDPARPGVYVSRGPDAWAPFRSFSSQPLALANPNAELVDVDGSGRADLLVFGDRSATYYRSLGTAGYGDPITAELPANFPTASGPRGLAFTTFASIFGDGLQHRVTVADGVVEAWPSLGHGRFGECVRLANAPHFGDAFDPTRVHLADVDGSGTADLVYLYPEVVVVWPNLSGNGFGEPFAIPLPDAYDDQVSITFGDVRGSGATSLVFSTTTPTRKHWFCEFAAGGKPYLLSRIENHLGARTAIEYAASTEFYLEDKRAGSPWATRLALPVQVVRRVEIVDEISGSKLVTRYAYHDGYFDPYAREFRGFGYVETWDTEQFEEYARPGLLSEIPFRAGSAETHVAPAYTRAWYLTGAYTDAAALRLQYESDFWHGDPDAPRMPEFEVEGVAHDDAATMRQATASLAGRLLRTEVYGLDGSEDEKNPYTVTSGSFVARVEQPRVGEHRAVVRVFDAQAVAATYERVPEDPRIQHSFNLAVDQYGNVERNATVYYPRREQDSTEEPADPALAVQPEQLVLLGTLAVMRFANVTDPYVRVGVPFEEYGYELGGLSAPASGYFTMEEMREAVETALGNRIAYGEPFTPGEIQARLFSWERDYYWNEAQTEPLQLGEITQRVLHHHSETAAFTPELVARVYDGRVTDEMLASTDASGGGYAARDGYWWAPSETSYYFADAAAFFLPLRTTTVFGGETIVGYDPYFMAPVETRRYAGDREGAPVYQVETAIVDYYALQPVQVTDPNGNVSQAIYDPLGHVLATSNFGHENASPAGDADLLTSYARRDDATFETVLANREYYLQGGSSFFYYDYSAWESGLPKQPPNAIRLIRETYVQGQVPPEPERIQAHIEFSDGFGRALEQKIEASSGPALVREADGSIRRDAAGRLAAFEVDERWIVSGRSVYNNKGEVVEQYLPYFTSTPFYEDRGSVEAAGYIPPPTVTRYDPLNRPVHVLTPKKFFTKAEYRAWLTAEYDEDDTIVESEYYLTHIHDTDPAFADQRNALEKAAVFFDTPAESAFDPMGRPFLDVQINVVSPPGVEPRELAYLQTRSALDIRGEAVSASDPRLGARKPPVRNIERVYSMTGGVMLWQSVDAGSHWTLTNALTLPVHTWDARGEHLVTAYDALERVTSIAVEVVAPESAPALAVRELFVYGDSLEPEAARPFNLVGEVFRQYDQSGLAEYGSYSLAGATMKVSRWLSVDFESPLDWSDPPSVPLETTPYVTTAYFDALGRISWQQTPDGSVLEPKYNRTGFVERMRLTLPGAEPFDVLRSVDYNANAKPLAETDGNGVTTVYEYEDTTTDLIGLTSSLVSPEAVPYVFQRTSYTYDAVGNLTRMREATYETGDPNATPLEPLTDVTTDALYRVIQATGRQHVDIAENTHTFGFKQSIYESLPEDPYAGLANVEDYTETYTYDDGNNLRSIQHDAPSVSWTRRIEIAEDSNRAVVAGEPGREYDANGDMLEVDNVSGLVWNFDNELVRATEIVRPDGHEEAYFTYDADGTRVRKIVLRYAADGALERVDETVSLGPLVVYRVRDAAGGTVETVRNSVHVSANDRAVAIVNRWVETGAADVRYQIEDRLASSLFEVDANGEILSFEQYYPYGGTAIIAGHDEAVVALKDFRYTGKEADDATGFYLMGARYYLSWLGRWLSPDPAGANDGLNLYAYVADNPFTYVDPTGTSKYRNPKDLVVPQTVPLGQPPVNLTITGHSLLKIVRDVAEDLMTNTTANTPPQVGPVYQLTGPGQYFQVVKNVLRPTTPNSIQVSTVGQTLDVELKSDYEIKNPGIRGSYKSLVTKIEKGPFTETSVATDIIKTIRGQPRTNAYAGKLNQALGTYPTVIGISETYRANFGGILAMVELFNIAKNGRTFKKSFVRGTRGTRSYFIGAAKGGAKAMRDIYGNINVRTRRKRERYYASKSLVTFLSNVKEIRGQSFASRAAAKLAIRNALNRKFGNLQG